MVDLDSGSIVSASRMRREDEWSLATNLALTKYYHGEVYRAKDPSLSRYSSYAGTAQGVYPPPSLPPLPSPGSCHIENRKGCPGARVCRVNAPRAVRRTGKRRQLFVLIIRDKEKAIRRNDDVMDDRNAEAPRQATILEARCYPSNMSTVFFVNSRSARRAMSDSRNAVKAIPRNYATSTSGDAAPQTIPAIQFLNTTSLSPPLPSIPGISLLSNVRPNRRWEPSWLALMDDEGKERVIAERLSLSDSRVLSFGRERKKEKGGGEDKGGGKYRETRRELLGISRAR
ncbi:hypothetical protein ALC62_13251 [Cyphomyrmex costatus]|uniref:Uncharacterized protein n=1 Tax=Cyphomyrmex costatus TaxID=456900 RepID=A0A195C5R9_9HYME|nr:hypothetical protein ALC62_13251 [Cyphomyrmex costatus]